MRLQIVCAAVAALALSHAGCVSSEVEQQVRDNAVVSAADERDWNKLTPDQRAQAQHDSAKAWATLNYSLNGVPIPAPYADPSPVPTPSPAPSAPK